MRIVIDLQSCQSGSSLGGIGRYSLELAKAMVTRAPHHEFIVALNNRNAAGADQIRREFKNILPQNAFRVFDIPAGCSYFHKDPLTVAAAEAIREAFIADLKPDAVHLTSHFEGLGDEVVTSIPHGGPPVAVTLYDLIPYVQQKVYLTDKTAKDHYLKKFSQLRNAKALLAISQFSADEGRQHVEGAPAIIANIRGGVDEKFQLLGNIPGIDDVLARHGTGKKFLLYTASFDQRKNHERLIKAFAAVPANIRDGFKLVMVGNGWSGVYNDLKRIGASLGVPESDIVFTGRVADDDLVALYNRAYLFVFPPLWEGLGLPPLEAMACGAPAIGSNTTSIPEVIGWSGAMFDPTDIDDISRLMTKAMSDDAYMQQLKTHAAQHHPKFTWDASAAIALDAIEQMVANEVKPARTNGAARKSVSAPSAIQHLTSAISALPPPPKERLAEFAYCLAANELEAGHSLPGTKPRKQGWITSWATRCGIASYSQNLIENLTDGVHIFASIAADAPARETNVDRCWTAGNGDDLSQLRKCLNEHDLTDVIIQFNYGFFDFFHLARLVDDQIQRGRRVYFTLHSTMDPPVEIIKFRLADLKSALAASSAIFVHSENDVGRLAALGLSSNVVLLSQGVRLIEANPVARKPNGRKRISSYGFFLPGKGLIELIEAFALLHQTRDDVELYMVNANYGDSGGVSTQYIADAQRRIHELGLDDAVTMTTDYLSDAESIAHLRTADLVVYPYQRTGESSSAAVRMGLASGRPVAVTPLPIFDDVRNATHTLPGTSPSEMAAGIDMALDLQAKGTPLAAKINASAAAWCSSNDVRHVANYLQRTIAHKSASQAWEVIAQPDLGTLPLGSAQLQAGKLISTAAPGVLSHGPYLKLSPGVYRIIVSGAATGPADAPAGKMKLTTGCGTTDLKVIDLPVTNGTLADTILATADELYDFEVALLVNAQSSITMTGYQILRQRFR